MWTLSEQSESNEEGAKNKKKLLLFSYLEK